MTARSPLVWVAIAAVSLCALWRGSGGYGLVGHGSRRASTSLTLSVWPRKIVMKERDLWESALRVVVNNVGPRACYVRRQLDVEPPRDIAVAPLVVRAKDDRGNTLEFHGDISKRLKPGPHGFIALERETCYGTLVRVAPLFPAMKKPGAYEVWFRYVNQESPRGLRADAVWLGQTEWKACSVVVK